MKKENANVSCTSIAYVNQKGEITAKGIGFTDKQLTKSVSDPSNKEPESVFGAASLSKVVFAYLVLKLIEENKANPNNLVLGKFSLPFDLDTPLHKALSQEHIFFPNALDMKNSSFVEDKNNPSATPRKANGANSLFTTASDYAKLAAAWINDPSEEMQAAFEPAVTMENDDWAIRQNVPEENKENLGWGLGWGLQLENGCDLYLMPNFKNDLEK